MSKRPPSLRRLLARLVAALAAVLALLVVVAVLGMVLSAREYRRGSQFGVARQAAANLVLTDLLSAETGSRGYTLTGRSDYLRPYRDASTSRKRDVRRLRMLVRGNRALAESAASVDRAGQAWFAEVEALVNVRMRLGGRAAVARVQNGTAKALQDAFRVEYDRLLELIAGERRQSLQRADMRRRLTLLLVGASALLAIAVAAAVARRIWKRIGGPVADLDQGVRRVALGDLSTAVPRRPAAVRELGALVAGFNQMQVDLVAQRDQVAIAARRDAALQAERELWKTVQSGLLPARLPRAPWMRLAARYRPSEADLLIGGDFYDAVLLPDGRLCLVVGDVSGHGAPAAAKAAGLRFAWRTMVMIDSHPPAVLRVLNGQIGTPDERAQGRFASLIHLIVSPDGGIEFAIAGHPPPLLLTEAGCEPIAVGEPGPPIGVFDDADWDVVRTDLPDGATLVCFTDGLIEARRDGEQFGTSRACEVLVRERRSPVERRVTELIDAARRFDDANLRDDLVVLALERPNRIGAFVAPKVVGRS